MGKTWIQPMEKHREWRRGLRTEQNTCGVKQNRCLINIKQDKGVIKLGTVHFQFPWQEVNTYKIWLLGCFFVFFKIASIQLDVLVSFAFCVLQQAPSLLQPASCLIKTLSKEGVSVESLNAHWSNRLRTSAHNDVPPPALHLITCTSLIELFDI